MFEEEKKSSSRTGWIIFLIFVAIFAYWFGKESTGRGFGRLISDTKVTPPAEVLNLQEAFVQVAATVKPAVVNISATQEIQQEYAPYEFFFGDPFEDFFDEFFNDPYRSQPRKTPPKRYLKRQFEATGSGVIIDPQGYILTNEHVVHGAEKIKVILSDETKYDAKVVGRDERTDLAIVKIKSSGPFPAARLGDSSKTRVGDWAIAIGSPFGLEQTVTTGIISAVRQSLSIEGRAYRDLLQTDAAINRGNSGGPLVNIHGEIIGINTAIYAPTGVFSGIGFAIPINQAKLILDDLIHKGKVIRGWLGVEINKIDEVIQKQFNLPDTEGVLVNNVVDNSPAEKSGLKRGDVIRSYNGKKIASPRDLQDFVGTTSPGRKVVVEIIRNGEKKTLEITLGEMPGESTKEKTKEPGEEKGSGKEEEWAGMKVVNLTPALAEEFKLSEDNNGVVVIKIVPNSPIEESGLQTGDLIKSINRYPTPTVSEFSKVTKKLKLSDGVVFDVNRRGRPLYISYQENE